MRGPRASEHAARVEDADRPWRHPKPLLWHTQSTTAAVWPQPRKCQTPSSRCSCKEGERSKWSWEASRATSSRLWRALAASMVARCWVVRDDNDAR